ncbi:hypothetical protein BWQ96_04212 [Gracilariopsis chorda]|uniref:Microsomal glutathione S-transferase 3 n=1 Tax=Gracilariopsis chorda TaxID=448386 RepID=A0A2V3IWE4_9FLOR|nr:hypothetical protein BWQ96_04212 [Gracilariopsis chorda]|eukprot:PXF46037.1 hypothetical protein BWQ96_04212 [Gracilariopsis chorda]
MVNFSWPAFSVILAIILAYLPHFMKVTLLTKFGKFDNKDPRAHTSQQSSVPKEKRALVTRLAGCHSNQIEMLGVYAAGVAANLSLKESDTAFIVLTALYVGFRALYIIVYAAPQVLGGNTRSITFVACMATVISIWSKAAL